MPGDRNTLAATLAAYRPGGAVEAADVDRVRALLDRGDAWSRAAPLHITGSAVVVHPPTGRVLLRWHERIRAWLQVGGHADPGETDPLAIAVREAVEETRLPDLRPWPDRSLRHVVVVPVPASAREPAHEHADLRYALATAQPDSAVPERPTAPLRWVAIGEAIARTGQDSLRETLERVAGSLTGSGGAADAR